MTGEKLEACWSCGAQPSVREREADEWIGSATMVSCDLAGCAGGEVWFTLEQWNRRTESAALKVERDAALSQMKSEERRADEALTELRLVQLRNGEKSSAIDFKTAQLWDSDQRVHQLETESAALRARVAELEEYALLRYDGCLSGDCPHADMAECWMCMKKLVLDYPEPRAAAPEPEPETGG